MYKEALPCTPETNVTFCANSTQIKNFKKYTKYLQTEKNKEL